MTLTFVEERQVPHLAANGIDTNTLMMNVLIAEQFGREVVLVDPVILKDVMEQLSVLRSIVALATAIDETMLAIPGNREAFEEVKREIASYRGETVSKLSGESVSRDVDCETDKEIDLDRRYSHAEHLVEPPQGYRFSYRDDDPGHPASIPYWVLVPNVS